MSNNLLDLDDTISDNSYNQDGGFPLLMLNNALSSVSSYYMTVNPIGNIAPDLLSVTSPYGPTSPIRIPITPSLGIHRQPQYSNTSSDFSQWQMNNLLSSVSSNIVSKKQSYIPLSMDSLNHRNIDNISLITNGKTGNNSFTGAGIMLFERNNDPDKKCVILFESHGVYQDLGGSIIQDDYRTGFPVSTCAKREAFEETAGYLEIRMNLNRVVNNTNIFAEIPANNPNYRSYAIGLEENAFNFGQYIGNVDKINRDIYALPQFKEISQARRFYLKNIEKCINNNSFQCEDTQGQMHHIRERSMLCLRELMKGGRNSVANIVTDYSVSRHQQYVNVSGFSKLIIF
jgi:hypothetical protein